MGDRYVKRDDDKKILYIDEINLYGHSMSQQLPYDEIELDKNVKLENVIITLDDSHIGYFIEVDLIYLDNIKEKTKHFHLLLKKINPDNFTTYMNKNKSNTYTQSKKLKCDWSDRKTI